MNNFNNLEKQYHGAVRAQTLKPDTFDLNIGFIFGFNMGKPSCNMRNLE